MRISQRVSSTGKAEVLLRFVADHDIVLRAKSGIFVTAAAWSDKKSRLNIPRIQTPAMRELVDQQRRLDDLSTFILDAFFNAHDTAIDKDWLEKQIYYFHNPHKVRDGELRLYDAGKMFLKVRKLSDIRRRNYESAFNMVDRYEAWTGQKVMLNDFTHVVVRDFVQFLADEHSLCAEPRYFNVMQAVAKIREPQPRGQNAINEVLRKIRALVKWCIAEGYTTVNAFEKYKIEESVYGTPYYITIEERDRIYHCDLHNHPAVAVQRDIFVFQCLIGCRVGDLLRLRKSNVIGGAVEYVPNKTKDDRPQRVRVPLCTTAKEIVDRYADSDTDALLPFISEQKYNKAIKRICRAARINRVVTIINPTTREEEQRPIYEIATSHMARRTFIGNLYKKVKDPNLIGSLSGHVEGSKAFARYRDIDEDIRREVVSLLED